MHACELVAIGTLVAICSMQVVARRSVRWMSAFTFEDWAYGVMACANHPQVSEEDFCEGGALAHLQMELQLWAAYRGQLLSRTVRGALALLVRLETGYLVHSPTLLQSVSRYSTAHMAGRRSRLCCKQS
jgi:hypothetical protein